MVFVLAEDGSFYALDDALTQVSTTRYGPPGPLSLALSEAPDPGDPSQTTCTLAYVTKPGGIAVFDASAGVPQPAGQWPSSGTGPTPVIGPQFVDGTVWAADVFGSAAAACPLPAPTAPVFRAPLASPPSVTETLEVSSARQLALLGGSELRLLAFTPGAQAVDRWASGSEAGPSWAMFWEPATGPATQPGLIVTVGKATAPGDGGFTVLVANTVDQPYIVTAPYPPAPTALVSGTLSLASGSGHASGVLTKPVIAGDELFALVADEAGAALLGVWPLQSMAATAVPAAVAELRRLEGLDNPVVVTVSIGGGDSSGELITVQGVGQVRADTNSQISLPGRLWGQTITASWSNWQGSVAATPGDESDPDNDADDGGRDRVHRRTRLKR
jgi:hypothetical protein